MMNKILIKKIKMSALSLAAVALLAACGETTGNEDEPTTDDPVVEEPAEDTGTEQPADDSTTGEDATGDDMGEEDAGGGGYTPVDTTNGIHNIEFPVSLEQAVQIFRDTFGEGVSIDEVDLDEDFRGYEYGITGWDDAREYDLDIDAHSGAITEQETENDSSDEDAINFDNIMAPQEAMDIAVKESGVDLIESWTLEVDDGMTVYDIDIQGADDLTINAETGDIVDR